MENKNKFILMIFSTVLFISCSSNEFCMDIKDQKILSNNSLSKIAISNLETGDVIVIRKRANYDSKVFNLHLFDTINYLYSSDYLGYKKVSNIQLSPNTTYKITNMTFGDVSKYVVKIKTDSLGIIIYSDCIE